MIYIRKEYIIEFLNENRLLMLTQKSHSFYISLNFFIYIRNFLYLYQEFSEFVLLTNQHWTLKAK